MAMPMSMIYTAAKGHVWVCGPPSARSVLVSVVHVTTQGHVDVHGLFVLLLKVILMSVDHVDVSGLSCHLRSGGCLWSVLLQRAVMGSVVLLQLGVVLVFMAYFATQSQADVHDVCCCLEPCG